MDGVHSVPLSTCRNQRKSQIHGHFLQHILSLIRASLNLGQAQCASCKQQRSGDPESSRTKCLDRLQWQTCDDDVTAWGPISNPVNTFGDSAESSFRTAAVDKVVADVGDQNSRNHAGRN